MSLYLVTMVRKSGPVTGRCATVGHGRRKARRTIAYRFRDETDFQVEKVCLDCADSYSCRPALRSLKVYTFDVETQQILTASGAAGNAMEWINYCAEQPGSDFAGFHAIDAWVAPESMTLNFASLEA